jgi:hypothetical protein
VLFDRRVKPTFGQKLRNFVWPSAGLRRSTRYIAHRVRRIPGSPYAIAAGFACGAAVSMTPFPGFHFLLSALLAWALRSSIIASAIGTVVGNPWTFPFIWLWILELGNWMTGRDNALASHNITMQFLWHHPLDLLLPMLIGSIPTALITWFVFFWPIRRMVATYQLHRRNRLEEAANAERARRDNRDRVPEGVAE